ncbi:MAG: AAA family ATPase [Phycisphaerales bacterium]|nr:AAA family ATPase [Phycisphaerales bacterium]
MGIILGHDRPLTTLRTAMGGDRMHHAWIFSGPVGVGKRTLAEEVARIVLDPALGAGNLGEPEPVLATDAGTLLAAGTHPDLHLIRKEDSVYSDNRQLRERKQLNIPLDLLRERMIGGRTSDGKIKDAPAYRTASMGHGKVFIIDEAELLDRTAQNVLLKTLEEPPSGTIIILVTSRPERLIPTIRSRCQQLPFGTLDAEAMKQWIAESNHDDNGASLDWLLSWSEGSPGRYENAQRHDLVQWVATLEPMLANSDRGQFAPELGATMVELIEQYAEVELAENPKASKEAANRAGVRSLIRLLGHHLRRQLAATDDDALRNRCCTTIDLLAQVEQESESHINIKQLMESLSASWTNPEPVYTAT